MSKRQADTSPNPLPPEATGAPPSGTSILFKVLSAAFSGALIVLILVWFRTRIDDYGTSVKDTISQLSAIEIVLLLIAGLVIMTLNGMAMKTPLNGISTKQAFIAHQSASAGCEANDSHAGSAD